jgi:hypothetical protein
MEENNDKFSIKQYILFKIDRSVAVLGLIGIAVGAMLCQDISDSAAKIITGISTALALYLGVRGK